MPIIEGFGDEVVQFFIVVVLIAIAVLAWQSTQIAELPLFRTLLIVERQAPHPQAATSLPTPSAPPADEEDKSESESSSNVTTQERVVGVGVENIVASNESADSETCVRQRRLPFLQNLCENVTNDENSSPSLSQNVEASTEDVGDKNTTIGGTGSSTERPTPPGIKIRIKYLNDDLKLVEGKLEEQLGDFKKRHFSLELSERKLVRLIFNGQILKEDSSTLRHYGLFDNCVVHCLVHATNSPQPPPTQQNQNTTAPDSTTRAPTFATTAPAAATPVRSASIISSWIVRYGFLTSLSFMLGAAWYGRIQYAQLYNATSTVALVGLTAIFTVCTMAIYRTGPEDTPL